MPPLKAFARHIPGNRHMLGIYGRISFRDGKSIQIAKKKHRKSAKLPRHLTFHSLKKIEKVETSLGKNWNRVGIFFKLKKS